MALRDIRDHIVRTKANDPNNFPPVEYKRYPLMMVDPNGKPYLGKNKKPVIVHNATQEDEFRKQHPDAPKVQDPEERANEIQDLRAENERLKAQLNADKGDNSSQPVKTGQVQAEATARASGNPLDNLQNAKPKEDKKAADKKPAGPAPGSKLDD